MTRTYQKARPSFSCSAYIILIFALTLSCSNALNAQVGKSSTWWFGVSAAANGNFYTGTTQTLNADIKAQSAFHEGKGIRPYVSLLSEYRPNNFWGIMLNIGYDGRGGDFNQVIAPCNCASDLTVKLSYLSIEPSVRIAPFSDKLYVFLGASANLALNQSFEFSQEKRTGGSIRDEHGDFNEINQFVFGSQLGIGCDIPMSSPINKTQMSLSPFLSFHPYLGRGPRGIESWSLTTVRLGAALKLGRVTN